MIGKVLVDWHWDQSHFIKGAPHLNFGKTKITKKSSASECSGAGRNASMILGRRYLEKHNLRTFLPP